MDPPVRPRPNRDGFTDRWVGGPGEEPSPGTRPPRMEKWGPEGDLQAMTQHDMEEKHCCMSARQEDTLEAEFLHVMVSVQSS